MPSKNKTPPMSLGVASADSTGQSTQSSSPPASQTQTQTQTQTQPKSTGTGMSNPSNISGTGNPPQLTGKKPQTQTGGGTRKTPQGGMIREGPKGPEHKHPGYPPGSGPGTGKAMKWHLVSQKHGSAEQTQQMHVQAGLGKDGLGGNRAMRESVGANADAGGGIMPAPTPDTTGQKLGQKLDSKYGEGTSQKVSTGARFAGLAALGAVQGFGDLAGKGFNMVNRFIQSVLSGNPLSPASTMLANTLDGMAGVNQSIRDTYDRYGVAMGVDMDSIAETVKGRQLKKDLELQEDGHNMAFEAVDNTLINVAGYQSINGEPPKLEDLGPHQLQRVNDELGKQADVLMDRLYQGREDGTLTDDEEKRIKAALEVYERGFDAIARQGDANAKKFKEQAKEIRAARALNKQMEAEIRRQAKEQKAQDNAQKLATAKQNGDYASVVLYQMGEKYYDTELTPDNIPVQDGVRQRYENELEDKIASGIYSQSEVQSMESRLRACRDYGAHKEAEKKRLAYQRGMNIDFTDDQDFVELALRQNNALREKVNRFGIPVGDKMTPKVQEDIRDFQKGRQRAIFKKNYDDYRNRAIQMLQQKGVYDPNDQRQARVIDMMAMRNAGLDADSDDEVQRLKTAFHMHEWTHMTNTLGRQLDRVPQNYLDSKGLTREELEEDRARIDDLYNEMGEKHGFIRDRNGDWSRNVPTAQEEAQFRDAIERIQAKYGIRRYKYDEGEGESDEESEDEMHDAGGFRERGAIIEPQDTGEPQDTEEPQDIEEPETQDEPETEEPETLEELAEPEPQGQNIDLGGRQYTPLDIKRIIGANPNGIPYIEKPNYAQSVNAAEFEQLNPTFVKNGKGMLKLTTRACNNVMKEYPQKIISLEQSPDPRDHEIADEMKKYLAYVQAYRAYDIASREATNPKNAGKWDLDGLRGGFEDFMRAEGRSWMDAGAPAPDMEELQGPSELYKRLKESYSITPIDENEPEPPPEPQVEPAGESKTPRETQETPSETSETTEAIPDEEPVWWDKVYLNGNPYLKNLPDEEIKERFDSVGTLNDDINAFRNARNDFPESLKDLAEKLNAQSDNLAIERSIRGMGDEESPITRAKKQFLERQSDEKLDSFINSAQNTISALSEKPDLTPEEQRELIEAMGTFGYAINEYKRRLNQPETKPEPPKTEEKPPETPEIPPETEENEVETPEIPPETEAEEPSEETPEEPSETVEKPEIQAETVENPAETVENEGDKSKTYLSDRVVGEGDKVSITDTLPPVTMVDKDGNTAPVVSTTDAQKKGLVLLGVLKEKDAANLKEYPQTQKAFKLQEQYLRSHLAQMGYEKMVRGKNFAHEPFFVAMSLMNDLVSSVPETQWSEEERQRYSDLQDMVNAATDNVKHALDKELRNRKDRETRERNARRRELSDKPLKDSVFRVADLDASDRIGTTNREIERLYNQYKDAVTEQVRSDGGNGEAVKGALEALYRNLNDGYDPVQDKYLDWHHDPMEYTQPQLQDFFDNTNLGMLDDTKQKAIKALTDTLNNDMDAYMESHPELAQKLKEAYPDEEPSDAAIRHPEALGDARNDVQAIMDSFSDGMSNVLHSKYKRAYRRAEWLGLNGDFEAVMNLLDPKVTDKNIKNTKKKLYSYKKKDFTPEGWEVLMKANDEYMKELEKAYHWERRREGGFNISLEGKEMNASPGMLTVLNADKAGSDWVKQLASDYWFDMNLLIERGLKSNKGKEPYMPKTIQTLNANRAKRKPQEEAQEVQETPQETPQEETQTRRGSRRESLENRPRKTFGATPRQQTKVDRVDTGEYIPAEGTSETLQDDKKLKFTPTNAERRAIDENYLMMTEIGVEPKVAEYLTHLNARLDHTNGRRVESINPTALRDYMNEMGVLTPEYEEALDTVSNYSDEDY